MRKGILILVAVMAVMSWPGISWPSSWYIVKDSGNEDIKYFCDNNGGYSLSCWTQEGISGNTLSGLLNGSDISEGDCVYICGGVYLLDSKITLAKSVKVYGGFSGNEESLSDRNITANPSVLSGQNMRLVLQVNAASEIDGLTITGGRATNGGGVLVSANSVILARCIITSNTATNDGGGVYFSGNSSGSFTHCEISGNKASINGGGIYSAYAVSFTGCTVSGNTSKNGAGIYIHNNSSLILENCTLTGNTASLIGGGLLINSKAYAEITNCTLAGNIAGTNNGGTHLSSSSSAEIYNCLIWNADPSKTITSRGIISLDHCALPEGITIASSTSGRIHSSDNVYIPTSWTPLPLEAKAGGMTHTVYRPESSPELSALIGKASPENLTATDQLGHARIKNTIGAIEPIWDGNGENDTPYIISTPEAMNLLASLVNTGRDYAGEYFCLSCDITYTTENYAAIGDDSCKFNGIFDGRGHAVKGMRLSAGGEDYCGLFGHVGENGVVKDIALKDIQITGKNHAGGIAGLNEGTISRCRVYDDVAIIAGENASSNHGGIAGTNAGEIESCVCGAEITAQEGLTGCENFGGIAGNNTGTITGCLYLGGITE